MFNKLTNTILFLKSCCFGDGVSVMSPCQVLSDVDTEEPEAADSLHRSPIDGDGGVSLLPVVHNQLLCFADVEMEVVILAPRYQGFDLLSLRRLVAVGDLADDGCVVSKQVTQI